MYIEYIKSNIKTFDDVNFFNKKYINYICDNMGLYIYNTPFVNDPESMFEFIKKITDKSLTIALMPFMEHENLDLSGLMKHYKYNYQDLFLTALFHVLYKTSFSFGVQTKNRISKELDNLEQNIGIEPTGKNIYRLKILSEIREKRNDENLKYFGIDQNYKCKMNLADADFYNFLSEYPLIRKFLHENGIKINKLFINKINEAYAYIDTKNGFNRFYLDYIWEYNSNLDLFTHIMYIFYNFNSKKTLLRNNINMLIDWTAGFPKTVFYSNVTLNKILNCTSNPFVNDVYSIYHALLDETNFSPINSTNNYIILGLYDIYNYFEEKNCNISAYNFIKSVFDDLTRAIYAVSNFVSYIINGLLIDAYVKEQNYEKYRPKDICNIKKDLFDYMQLVENCKSSCDLFTEMTNKYSGRKDYRLISKMESHQLLLKWLNHIYCAD